MYLYLYVFMSVCSLWEGLSIFSGVPTFRTEMDLEPGRVVNRVAIHLCFEHVDLALDSQSL